MTARIIASLILMSVGALTLYTVWAKPQHSISGEPLDQALGIPRIVTRMIRGAFGLLFILIVIIGMLRTLQVLT
jgi:hypothetical protein